MSLLATIINVVCVRRESSMKWHTLQELEPAMKLGNRILFLGNLKETKCSEYAREQNIRKSRALIRRMPIEYDTIRLA